MRNQQKPRGLGSSYRHLDIEQFYDPLKQTKPIKNANNTANSSCVTLFNDDDDDQFIISRPVKQKAQPREESLVMKEDPFLKKIFANSKMPPKPRKKDGQSIKIIPQYEPYCFNSNIVLKYPQTPHFKNQLQSPFWKFNADHKVHMETLKQKTIKADFTSVNANADPLKFVSQSLKYFVGVAINLKEKNCIHAARAMLKLGCFVEPFNEKAWKRYIQNEQLNGYVHKAFMLSKTAFLFTQNQEFARSYLANGQKCGIALGEMRGILNSTQSPEIFEKGVLLQIGKLTLKHQQIWKGLKILYEIIQWNDYRLPVCALIIFLAKYLENIGQRDKALMLLKRSFGRGMSKLQIYTTYLEIKLREENGILKDSLLKEVLDYTDFISSENRYKLYLEIAELLFKRGDMRYKYYIQEAFLATKKFCAPGSGCNKTLKQIYYTIIKWKNLCPPFVANDTSFIENNRYDYITKGTLKVYEFSDWKYFLHYGLLRKSQILFEATKKWSYTGRLIAEWIHSLRISHSPKEVLKIWREKVDEVPKSGELWCQGGRIYAQLHEYENASKCFRAAMHFTPQFGDSFIEQLRVYLMKGQFHEAHKLKKITFISEPFYGHVWSFLRESNSGQSRLCLNDMWQMAMRQINSSLYRENLRLSRSADKDYRLLTAYSPYNEAYMNPCTPELRRKLFASYEQLENKN